jgi:hypothetical protein
VRVRRPSRNKQTAPPTGAPDQADGSDIVLQVDSEEVPSGLVLLGAVIVNEGRHRVGYGPDVQLWRWDGQAWEPTHAMLTRVANVPPVIRVQAQPFDTVPAIALGAEPGGRGPDELIPLPHALEPGEYRVTRQVGLAGQGEVVTVEGRFSVVDGLWPDLPGTRPVAQRSEDPPPALEGQPGAEFAVHTDQIPAGRVVVQAAVASRSDATVTYGPEAQLWQWDGVEWQPIFAMLTHPEHDTVPALLYEQAEPAYEVPAIDLHAEPGKEDPRELVPVPHDLEPGTYRITRPVMVGDQDMTVEGRFTVYAIEQP